MFIIKAQFSQLYIGLTTDGKHQWVKRSLAQRFDSLEAAEVEIIWILQHESLIGDMEIVKWDSKR